MLRERLQALSKRARAGLGNTIHTPVMKCKCIMWWNGNNKLEHPPAQKKVEERSCNISQSGTQHRGIYMQKRQGYPKLCGVYVWVFYTYFVLMSLKHIGKRSSWRECKEPKARSQSRDPPGNVTSLTTASKCEGYMLTFVFLPRPLPFFFLHVKDPRE